MKQPKLTIAITTYNHENYLKDCLEGIIKQKTNFLFQAIVSDDISTDNTRYILKEYAEKYPDIIKPVYQKKNLGPMKNFIATLNSIHTEYVALCDGDDFWTDENKLQKQVDFLENNKEYNVIFHKTTVFYEMQENEEVSVPVLGKNELTFDDLLKECFIPANTVVYRWKFQEKDSFLKKFPKEVVPGDYFVHLYHAYTGKIKFIPEVMSKYRKHDGGMWWLATEPGKEDEFHIKYGHKYLNFFKQVESEFKLDEKIFQAQKKWLIDKTSKAYLKNNMYNEMDLLYKENQRDVELYTSSIKYEEIYNYYTKPKRVLYLLLFDNNTFKNKIKDKIISKPILKKIYNAFSFSNKKSVFCWLLLFIVFFSICLFASVSLNKDMGLMGMSVVFFIFFIVSCFWVKKRYSLKKIIKILFLLLYLVMSGIAIYLISNL